MIVTITPNPAIDQFYWVDEILMPETALLTRANDTLSSAGGKGINVSMQLNYLGMESTTMGFIAGYMGHAVEHSLHEHNITTNFVWTDGETRANVIVIVDDKEVSPIEVNATGPLVSEMALHRFQRRYQNALQRCDYLMCGGSLAPGLDVDFYKTLLTKAHDKNVKIMLYGSGDEFNHACELGPWMSKPDVRERSEVLGKPIGGKDQAYEVGQELLKTGSEIVVMAHSLTQPLADQMVFTKDGVWNYKAGDVETVNRVGAGDTFMAGMLFKLLKGSDVPTASRYGMAASLASTESKHTTVANRNAIEQALQRVEEEVL